MSGERLIAQRYRLEQRIGTGGMGEVWLATDVELGRPVALKRSHDDDAGQIRHEGRIAAGLQHPNVIAVFDSVLDDGTKWLVMEYLPARSLAEIIRSDGPLPPETAAVVGAQIAAALAAMHQCRMIHRDVTPANVLVTPDHVAKLTDFGISHWAELTQTGGGRVVGTPAYLAPEVANGKEARGPADVFSLGATLFAAVEGHSPWGPPGEGPNGHLRRAMAADQQTPAKAGVLAPVLAELLRPDPASRPSAVDAKRMLDTVGGVAVPVVPLPEQARPQVAPRRRRLGVLVGAVVLVAAVGAGVAIHLERDSNAAAHPRP
jgi:eukaryotic-like serine/threonine-protein kinase